MDQTPEITCEKKAGHQPAAESSQFHRARALPKNRSLWLLVLICMLFSIEDAVAQEREQQVCGWLERVQVFPGDLVFRAKMDTGAKHSSLNARNIVPFEKNGDPWVRFVVRDRNRKKLTVERPMVRTAEIKLRGKQKRTQERPVIILGLCLGTTYKEVEVNLVDRRHFNYQMLIGRSYLQGDFLVDVVRKFTLTPNCRIEDKP